MLSTAVFTLLALVLVVVLTIPKTSLSSSHPSQWTSTSQPVLEGDHVPEEWDLDTLPNPNDTSHLVFETVYSLLQHWPNTRMRNGHNIVPGVIPKGTLLYHGMLSTQTLPPGPDWVATDPEHAYIFCVDPFSWLSQESCFQVTLATTRPLKVIYFDGTSSANLPSGTADTQQLLVWGRSYTGNWREELQLIQDLCKWGKKFGIDGFVRMEMDFEVMICDFTAGLSVVTSASLGSRGPIRPKMPGWTTFEVMESGSWHNHFPGETRIQLDLAGLVSFYDTRLVPSLVAIRAGQERWDHRAQNISSQDLSALRSRLETTLAGPSGLSSGIDWKTLFRVIVHRFAGRLELTRHLLNSSVTDPNEILDLANKVQTQLRVMLTPYLLLSAVPIDPSNKDDLDWTRPIYKLCASTHTDAMTYELNSMTESERLLLRAVRGTTREVCRIVTKMWATGVYAGIDQSLNTEDLPDVAEVVHVWNTWTEDLNRLMGWLDWSVWVKCDPGCGPEEMCYLPTWPVGFPVLEADLWPSVDPDRAHPENLPNFVIQSLARKAYAEEIGRALKPEPNEWIRPHPKCIRRVVPREF